HNTDIFLGYSNLQAEGLSDKNDLTGLFGSNFFNNRTTLHGFDTEVTRYLTDSFGITGNFSFNENSRSNRFFGTSDSLKTDIFYFMGGPTLTVGHSSRLQPFVRVLAGGSHTRFDVSAQPIPFVRDFDLSFRTGTTDFAMA